jgi:phosphoribosylglycinamide formyltransferase-1
MSDKKRVAILISGRGSNMTALIQAARSSDYPAKIVGVFSNRAAAPGLDVARSEDIPTASLAQSRFESRLAFDNALTEILEGWNADIVCMAGFMRILSPEFTNHWLGKAINIHPSLLPAYKGLDTHARASMKGRRFSRRAFRFIPAIPLKPCRRVFWSKNTSSIPRLCGCWPAARLHIPADVKFGSQPSHDLIPLIATSASTSMA